jgi:hypothetical protein
MKIKIGTIIFLVLIIPLGMNAQTLFGVVLQQEHLAGEHEGHEAMESEEAEHGEHGEGEAHEAHTHIVPVPGAVVVWAGTGETAITDEKGRFRIKSMGYPAKLVIAAPGLKSDTLLLEKHPDKAISYVIKGSDELKGVEVTAYTSGFSLVEPRNMQLLTQSDIKKAACCNLSESFETNASVDVNYTDAVSGTKTIRMLGLDGVYSQLMFENIPFIRGLESKYGLTLLPGTWVESIQITKGAGSVTNGFESMTGQINVEFQKPDVNEREMFYVNAYLNTMLRAEVNLHYRQQINKVWSAMLFLHGMEMSHVQDLNGDGFADSPHNRTLAGMVRLRYINRVVEGYVTVGGSLRYNLGGQLGYIHPDTSENGHNHGQVDPYGVQLNSKQGYVMWKNGFLLPNKKYGSIGLTGMVKFYQMDALFGQTRYFGDHRQVYFNSIRESVIKNTLHKYRTGLSYQMDDYHEYLNDSLFRRVEHIPGAHLEYTYNDDFRWNIVAGARVDYHSLYGWWFVPRLHVKYQLNEKAAIRYSGGRGYRRQNAVAENLSLFASSRRLVMDDNVAPEETWNTGLSFTSDLKLSKMRGIFRFDYYYTWFANQWLVNLENPNVIRMVNVANRAYSHSTQADLEMEVVIGLDVTLAYRFNFVRSLYNGEMNDMPFIPRSRALLNLAYETPNKQWRFDFTTNSFGYSRIPDTRSNPEGFRLKSHSDPYVTLNLQITKSFRFFEVYAGGENLLNYIQPNAIIDAANPFGSEFDASLIWGPLNGTIGYIGIRTKLKSDKNIKIKEK